MIAASLSRMGEISSHPFIFSLFRPGNGIRLLQILIVEREADETNHHLFPSLLTPAHLFGRIGVPAVFCRIIEVGDAFETAALWRRDGFGKFIARLPVEII